MPYKTRGKCVYKKTGKRVGCTSGDVKKYLAALHANVDEQSIPTFKTFHDQECNVDANELKPGDAVENINPDCDHYKSVGVVTNIKKVEQDDDKTAGNIVVYTVRNNSDIIDARELNGTFHPGDELEKTEIQLKKLNEWVKSNDHDMLLERRFDKQCDDVCKQFVSFCKKHLQLEEPVKIKFIKEKQPNITTGCYMPQHKQIVILTKDRGLIDVLRSVAHEMVHQKQHMSGQLNDLSGETGSDHENEANATAGVIMRQFQDLYSDAIY